jgi:hypothetical protein
MLDNLKIWVRFDAKHVPRNFIYGIKNLIKWFPIICKDRDWDTFYIFEILRFKLKNQGEYIGNRNIHTQAKRDSEQILLCTKLIKHCQDEYYNMEYLSYYENKITFRENLDKLKSDIKSYEINDVFLSENFSEYFKKYPRQYKKVIIVGSDKMSVITDYTDRTICPLFGDAAAAVLLEPTSEDVGIIDHMFKVNGEGRHHLYQKAGGSAYPPTHETIDAREHFIYQDGKTVFKFAVSNMADYAVKMMKKHNINPEELAWLVPHQANMRIIDATAKRIEFAEFPRFNIDTLVTANVSAGQV